MKFDYGTQLSPDPILLSVGHLKKPKLCEISELTFGKFNFYEVMTKMTPDVYYEKVLRDKETPLWDSLTFQEKERYSIYDFIIMDEELQKLYTELFDFFFVESVFYTNGMFVLFKEVDDISTEGISGVIGNESFERVMELIQQVCCIHSEEKTDEEKPKFKNKLAQEIYERIHKGEKKESAKYDVNLSIPNLISAVSAKHPSINLLNIWDLTVFQLIDSFYRLQTNAVYDIDSARVSAWGDEKNTFDASLWYKNNYDKDDQQ